MSWFLQKGLSVNEAGNLTIGGCDTTALAAKYGTPLYVFNEDTILENCRRYKKTMDNLYAGNDMVIYASKAFCCKAMCRIAEAEGMGLDVVSGGELYTALEAGFPAKNIFFHGNNKTPDELLSAVVNDVGTVVVDNIQELELLNKTAVSQRKKMRVMLRVKPGVGAHTHDYVRTGQIDSKFGFALETGEALNAAVHAQEMSNIELYGLHCHIGSQIFEDEPFAAAAEVMLGLFDKVREKTGVVLSALDLGGGFGIRYVEANDPSPVENTLKLVADRVTEVCSRLDLPVPKMMIEPGRSIVGDAGITLYHVGTVKNIPGIRTYVSVDGGMTDNPRYALYHSEYTAVIANKALQPADSIVTIAGKCCESGDLLGENLPLQSAETGDILAMLDTGAYCYSMASNYNRIPRPAAVLVKNGGHSELMIRRETWEDAAALDI